MTRASIVLLLAGVANATPPSGSLRSETVTFGYAVYFAPSPSSDPERAVAARCSVELAPFERARGAPGARPRLAIKRAPDATLATVDDRILELCSIGVTDEQRRTLKKGDAPLYFWITSRGDRAVEAVHAADRLADCAARATAGFPYDVSTRQVLSAAEWRKRRVDSWKREVPNVEEHTVIHEFPHDELINEDTLGMEKFGLPDLTIDQVTRSYSNYIGRLINLTMQRLVAQPQLDGPGRLALERATLSVDWKEHGDHGRALVIRFDAPGGGNPQQQQMALLAQMFGKIADPVVRVAHDDEMQRLSNAAKKRIAQLYPVFRAGLPPGDRLVVKAPFATPSGGREWMWLEVTAWDGDKITGILDNDADEIPDLRVGARVTVSQATLFDYIYAHGGKTEGNETGKLMQRRQAR